MKNAFSLKKISLVLVICLLLLFVWHVFQDRIHVNYPFGGYLTKTLVLPGDYEVNAYRATTADAREQGLSRTSYLAPHDGMLFEFPYENQWYFWMKDMVIPIDIIWIDKRMTVIYIEKNLNPDTYPQSFGPASNALYVLEVASGVSEKTNLKVGDKIIFK